MTTTTTVRIGTSARTCLESVARARSESLVQALDRIVADAWWEEACRSEREGQLADLANPEAIAELEDWDTTTGDGLEQLG